MQISVTRYCNSYTDKIIIDDCIVKVNGKMIRKNLEEKIFFILKLYLLDSDTMITPQQKQDCIICSFLEASKRKRYTHYNNSSKLWNEINRIIDDFISN